MFDDVLKPTLSGPRITLRAPQDGDVDQRFALGNHAEIQQMFGADKNSTRPLTQDAAQAWVADQINTPHAFIIEYQERLIGAVRIHMINPLDRRAHLSIGVLDPTALGKGLGTEAMRLIAKYGFESIGLHRLTLRVLSYNERAIKAYEKVGFQVEGRERETAFVDGVWHDDYIMGLLAREFEPLTEQVLDQNVTQADAG